MTLDWLKMTARHHSLHVHVKEESLEESRSDMEQLARNVWRGKHVENNTTPQRQSQETSKTTAVTHVKIQSHVDSIQN